MVFYRKSWLIPGVNQRKQKEGNQREINEIGRNNRTDQIKIKKDNTRNEQEVKTIDPTSMINFKIWIKLFPKKIKSA